MKENEGEMAAQDFMEDPIYGFIYELYIRKADERFISHTFIGICV